MAGDSLEFLSALEYGQKLTQRAQGPRHIPHVLCPGSLHLGNSTKSAWGETEHHSHQRKNKSNSTPGTLWNWGWRREPSSPLQENLPKTSLLNIPVPPFQQIVSLWGLILLHLFLYFKGIWIQFIWKLRGLNFVLLVKIDYIRPRFIKFLSDFSRICRICFLIC